MRSLRKRSLDCRKGATRQTRATWRGTRLSLRTWYLKTSHSRTFDLTCCFAIPHCSVKTKREWSSNLVEIYSTPRFWRPSRCWDLASLGNCKVRAKVPSSRPMMSTLRRMLKKKHRRVLRLFCIRKLVSWQTRPSKYSQRRMMKTPKSSCSLKRTSSTCYRRTTRWPSWGPPTWKPARGLAKRVDSGVSGRLEAERVEVEALKESPKVVGKDPSLWQNA